MAFLAAVLGLLTAGPSAAPGSGLEGVWCWGSPRRSADVPFLEVSRVGDRWAVRTKHYMHAYFVGGVKDIRVTGGHLEFTYRYEPLNRWAHCAFDAEDDRLVGTCDGEIDARTWGAVPSYLWRAATPGSEGE